MKKYLLATAAIFAIVPFQARAVEVDDAGADHLKQVFTELLEDQKEINSAINHIDIIYSGDVKVEPKGTYYAITLPHVKIKLDDDIAGNPAANPAVPKDAEAFNVDLGITAINAMPDEEPGRWKMTVAIPATISVNNGSDFSMKMNVGSQNTAGLFNENYGYFTKLDSTLKDIKFNISSMGDNVSFGLGDIVIKSNLEEDGQGYLSGPTSVKLGNLSFDIPEEKVDINVGAIRVVSDIKKYKALSRAEYKEKMLALGDKLKSLDDNNNSGAAPKPPSPDQVEDLLNSIFSLSDFEGVNVRYGIENLGVTSQNPNDNFNSIKVGNGFFALGLGNLKSEEGSFNIGMGYSGVAIDPMPQGYQGILPDAVNIALSAQKIPMQSIWTLLTNTAKGVSENPDMAQMAGFGLLMKLPMMLSQAGTQIVINNNYIKSPVYKIALDGTITADMNAVTNVVADLKGKFDGLDEVLGLAQASANNPNVPDAGKFRSIVGQLGMLKSFGKAGTSPDGKSSYSYDIKMTPDGKMLVNGQDMSALTGGGAPPAGQAGSANGGAVPQQQQHQQQGQQQEQALPY